jgi:hypothetical protein
MAKDKFSYMGKNVDISLNKTGDAATITIDKKKFPIKLHTEGKPEDNYIRLWMCPDAYSMADTPEHMARHIVEYWHQFA